MAKKPKKRNNNNAVKRVSNDLNEFIDILRPHCKKKTAKNTPIQNHDKQKINSSKKATTDSNAIGITENSTTIPTDKKPQVNLDSKPDAQNVSHAAENPAKKKTDKNDKTKTDGEPISLATGEEQLAKQDGILNSHLPFIWQRFYRTSAVEMQYGLGYGWSHSLSHQLSFYDDHILWRDDENRLVKFPNLIHSNDKFNNRICAATLSFGQNQHEYLVYSSDDKLTLVFIRQNLDNFARLAKIMDRHQNTLTIEYNPLNQITAISSFTEQQSRRLAFVYEENSEILSGNSALIKQVELQVKRINQWHTLSVLAKYWYNNSCQLIAVTNAIGDIERYEYDNNNVILKRTVPGGAEFYWEWEKQGKNVCCLHQWANYGQLDDHYQWHDEENAVTVTHQDGSKTYTQHNNDAKLVKEISGSGYVSCYEYDKQGQLITATDGEGRVTRYKYSTKGFLSEYIPPDGKVIYYDYLYNEIYSIIHGQKQERQKWRFRRNPQGDLIEFFDPQYRSTQFNYNLQGKLINVHYPDGSHIQLVWSEHGELLEEMSSSNGIKQYRYDEAGRLIWASDNGQETQYIYDALDRLIKITLPDKTVQEFHYNAYSEITHFKDQMGRITEFNYASPLNLLTEKRLPNGKHLRYRYDNIHLLTSQIENQKGEKYQLSYTPDGMLNEEISFDDIKTTYRYNQNNELIEKCEFGDNHDEPPLVTRYEYNEAGQIAQILFADGTIERYEYDSLNRLKSVNDNHHVLVWEYNDCNQLIAEHQNWATLRHHYDDDTGLLSETLLPDGQLLAYHYRQGQLRAMTLNNQPLAAFSCDNQGRERERRLGNGLINRYQFDAMNRLSAKQTYHGFDLTTQTSPSTLWQQHYHYQADSELIKITGVNSSEYQYDSIGQLRSVSHLSHDSSQHHAMTMEQFHYDHTGNLITHPQWQPDHPKAQLNELAQGNRLLFYGDRHFEYDRFGNLIIEKRGKNQCLITNYHYDCRHRLIKVVKPNGDIITYTYDAFNRRTSKTVSGCVTEYVWQGNRMIAETSDNDKLWRSYIYEAESYIPLVLVEGNARNQDKIKTYWYQTDHLGTPLGLTDSLGELIYQCQYSAFGEIKTEQYLFAEQGITPKNPLRFQGQYYDDETGLHYNNNRYYDPNAGRFITQDPIGLMGGINLYAYAPNPLGWVDPLGMAGSPMTATHITYLGIDAATGKPYVGYASMQGHQKVIDVLNYRYGSNFDRFGGTLPDILFEGYGQLGKDIARGLEQRTFEDLGGLNGTANKQNPVGLGNSRRKEYLNAADEYLINKKVGSKKGGGC